MTDNLNNLYQLPSGQTSQRAAKTSKTAITYPPHDEHTAVASRLNADVFSTPNGESTVSLWQGEWWTYTGTHWRAVDKARIRKMIWDRLDQVSIAKTNAKGQTRFDPWLPNPTRVTHVMERLGLQNLIDSTTTAPTWLGEGSTPTGNLMAMGNGLLNLDTRTLHDHTVYWFTTWAVDFDYDKNATCPNWNKFLDGVFAHDPRARDLLQEFAGYIVSGRTNLQKALLMVGVKRAGKGTILRILEELVGGVKNVGTPTLRTLNGDFGLQQLIGKPLAKINDARNDSQGNSQAVEKILQITGEDTVTVQRKSIPDWVGQLPARFVIASNEVPRFVDASGAIASRFVAFHLPKSFSGGEDRRLFSKLKKELPGILLWALDGLQRLDENNGVFTIPDTQADLLETVEEVAAPVQTFLTDNYDITHDDADIISRTEVYRDYKDWCSENGYQPTNADGLASRIKAAAIPGVGALSKRNPPGVKPARQRVITGISKRF